jgi:hypothetical protein
LRDRLDSQDPGDINYLLNVTAKNFGYAVGKASLRWALKEGFSKFLKQDPAVRFIRKYVHFGNEPASIIGNRSALRPVLATLGWRKFGARAGMVERYVNKVTDKLIDKIIAGEGSKYISGITVGAMDRLYDQVMAGHPSDPVAHLRIRRALAIDAVYAPLAAPATAMRPFAAQAAAPASAAAPRAAFRPDPVTRTITREDHYVQADFAVERSHSTYQSTPEPPPPAAEPGPSQHDIERAAYWHHEFECQGTRNKPGCPSSWDGAANQTSLNDR